MLSPRSGFVSVMVLQGFVPDHFLELVLGGLEVVPGPVEGLKALVVGQVDIDEKLFEVGVLEAVLDGVALLGVEHQHLLKQAVSVRVRLGEDLLHSLLVALGQLADVASGQIISNEGHVVRGGCTQYRNSSLDLIQIVVSWEKRRATQEFGEDAAERPDIKGVGVVTSVEDNLRSAIPTGDDVLCQRRRGLLVSTSKTEIANLERAVLVE